jgi:ribosomal protein S18 acetylase RimI-like enzyme
VKVSGTPALFFAGKLAVRTFVPSDREAILEVYRQCEDFLSLGPVSKASMHMVEADIRHSKNAHGVFCVIEDEGGTIVGVLDFTPPRGNSAAVLSLLMISKKHRNRGYGVGVFEALERYLRDRYAVQEIESGVQVNNPRAIRFWKKRGFQIGTEPISHDDGTTAFDMRKVMDPAP